MLNSSAAASRLLVLDSGGVDGGGRFARPDDHAFDVFEIVSQTGDLIIARSAYLFEVGEELAVRIEQDGGAWNATARVRGHQGTTDVVTELEISGRTATR